MQNCEIYHVPHKRTFGWKWRYVQSDGRAVESKEVFQLYYECLTAARERGLKPALPRKYKVE
jgi:hypothetical protein